MRADIVDCLGELDAAEWNRLAAPAGVYQSHNWLSTMAGENGAKSWYATIRGRDGALLGVLPVHWSPDETSDAYRPDVLFAELPAAWHEPGVIVGSQRGYQNRLVLDPALEPAQRHDVIGALLDAMHEVRSATGLESAYLFYATTETVEALRPHRPGAVPVLTDMEAVLMLPGREFGDYLDLFPSRKAGVLREMRAFEAAGYSVTTERLADTWREIAPIRANVDRRHGREWTDEAMADLMRRYAAGMDDISGVHCCRLDGELVACSVFHEWGDTLYLRMVGFDYPRLRDAYEYFNLMFYLPVQRAYATGRRRVHYGVGSYHAKVLRKASLHPLWTVNLAADGPADSVDAWNDRHLARWRADFAGYSWAFPAD